MSPRARKIKLFVVILSLFVFLLALNAKLSLYEHSAQANATSSSKLWLNGQKMEMQTQSLLVFSVLSAILFLLSPRFHRSPWTRARVIAIATVPSVLPDFEQHRFLRPPPSL
jgi:hypothetical protein